MYESEILKSFHQLINQIDFQPESPKKILDFENMDLDFIGFKSPFKNSNFLKLFVQNFVKESNPR